MIMNYRVFFTVLFSALALIGLQASGQNYNYSDSWGEKGFNLVNETRSGIDVVFSVTEFSMSEQNINGEMLKTVHIPGFMLQNNEGAPNLPGNGQYFAIPEGATPKLEIVSMRTETLTGVNVAPAPKIPLVTDLPPLEYEKDLSIYTTNAFYPAKPIQISEVTEVRGVDVAILGITPFQYNPVTKELKVIRDIELRITFEGGNGTFGEERFRSRFWDPMMNDMLINYASLPEIDYTNKRMPAPEERIYDYEYVIIHPDNAPYIYWADSLRKYRNAQGIKTGVFSLTEVGGNNSGAIEAFINDAYYNWVEPPAAFLLLADYGTTGNNSIISPFWDGYCVSDNIYADVTGNDLPDVALARITAQNEEQLEHMLSKMFDYETDPPINPDFYDNPISAGGWQSDRWFILCADIICGFWENELGKDAVREYAGFSGGSPSYWSTNSNTSQVVDYFGPNGLGYIPSVPNHLTDWGGNATRINNDLNSGAFMIWHRDHGVESGWDSPHYYSSNLSGLDENDLSFVFSINCLTGKYNISGECFVEAFHRHDYGAVGVIGASEVSYSFVNDAYAWGMMDDMWPDFDPGYGVPSGNSDWIRPAFANASGKWYLSASSWPSNPQNKEVTYHLFHHHGDAFLNVYSEVPQNLSVTHNDEVLPGTTSFAVSANSGSLIGLSIDGEFVNSATATGGYVNMTIPEMEAGEVLTITVTKQNYYRYEGYAVAAGPPSNASSPVPENHKLNQDPFIDLHWSKGNGGNPDYYKVFLGTDNPPTNLVNGETTTDTMYVPANDLDFSQEYFWRIESHNSYGSATGATWDFVVSAPPDEDFESGDFNAHDWYFGGDTDWVIATDFTRHGSYTAKSGSIDAGQTSSMIIDLEAESMFGVPIIFWVKTSTVENDNKLEFYIDGNLKAEWSGETDWTKESFFVTTGIHTFEWRYVKTTSSGSDMDCIWVDYIKFPPNESSMTASAGVDGSTCEGSDYQLEGSAQNYGTIEWTTSGDGSFDDNTILEPVYTPGGEDIETGEVTLTITAYDNSDESASDDMLLTIVGQPSVYAGGTVEICFDESYQTTSAYAENCVSMLWTTSGDGTFDDNTILDATYTPGTQDLEDGSVTLTLSAQGIEPCGETSDELNLAIVDIPEVPGTPTGPDYVDIYYTTTSEYTTSGSANAITYQWNVNPEEAGDIQGSGTTAEITWDNEYLGQAFISTKAINLCGESEFSEEYEVTVNNTVGIIANKTSSFSAQIIPNPNSGDFVLQVNSEKETSIEVRIIDVLGNTVYQESEIKIAGDLTKRIQLSDAKEGLYLVFILDNHSNLIKKLVVR